MRYGRFIFLALFLVGAADADRIAKVRRDLEQATDFQQAYATASETYRNLDLSHDSERWDFYGLMAYFSVRNGDIPQAESLINNGLAQSGISDFASYYLHYSLADIHKVRGQFEKAEKNYELSFGHAKKVGDLAKIISAATALAYVYSQRAQKDKVIEFLNILKEYEEQAPPELRVMIYAESAGLNYDLENYEQAVKYGKLAISTSATNESPILLSIMYSNLGLYFSSAGDNRNALDSQLKALQLAKKSANRQHIAKRQYSVGETYFLLKDFQKALQFLDGLPEEFDRMDLLVYRILSRRYLANVLVNTGDLTRARESIKAALSILPQYEEGLKRLNLEETLLEIDLTILEKTARWKEALHVAERIIQLKIESSAIEKEKGISELRVQFDTAVKEHENEKLSQKAELDAAALAQEKRAKLYYFAATIAFAAFSSVLLALLFFIRNILSKLREEKRLSEEKSQEIAAMLSTIEQGIFTIDEVSLKIGRQTSSYARRMFSPGDVEHLPDFLARNFDIKPDQISIIRSILASSIDMMKLNFELNAGNLPLELARTRDSRRQLFEVEWVPMCRASDQRVEKFLICIRDVTELRLLKEHTDQYQTKLRMLGEMGECGYKNFKIFCLSYALCRRELGHFITTVDGREEAVAAFSASFLRNVHTIKGSARMFGLHDVSDACHAIEETMKSLQSTGDASLESATGLIQQLDEAIAVYQNLAVDKFAWDLEDEKVFLPKTSLRQGLECISQILDATEATGARQDLARFFREWRQLCYVHINRHIEHIALGCQDMARTLGKPMPRIRVHGPDIFTGDVIGVGMSGILSHLFRNSMDHGIESPEQRRSKGKEDSGVISITLVDRGDRFTLDFEDDGSGLNLARILEKAVELKLTAEQGSMTALDVARFIVHPGFSTKQEVTDISGRGIGMDAIQSRIEDFGGSLLIILDAPSTADLSSQHVKFRMDLPKDLEKTVPLIPLQQAS